MNSRCVLTVATLAVSWGQTMYVKLFYVECVWKGFKDNYSSPTEY